MAPTIRYATTADGVSIAFATLGEGVPVVFMPPVPFSHLEAMWGAPGIEAWLGRLARGAQVAVYDARGTGLSDCAAVDFSIDAMIADLDAVVGRLGWDEFVLCGFFNASAPAIAYAARHPERVSDLVLWGGFARGSDYPLPMTVEPSAAVAQWPMLVDTAARTWTAGSGDEARRTAEYFRACVEPFTAVCAFVAAREYDVRELLGSVRARTLVIQRRDAPSQRLDVARGLAAAIPEAQLQVLAGESASPFSGDIDACVRAVEAFLGIEEAAAAPQTSAAESIDEALTAREAEVLVLVARGRANKEIAAALGLSVHTVERHLTNLYPKIGCRSRTEAAAFALTHGYA